MLQTLISLATEADSGKRRALLGAISDKFYNNGRDHIAESEIALFAQVVTRVLRDMLPEDRAEYSAIVAANPRTPHDVALALANDGAAVATPMLEKSPALTDDDLVAIASTRTLEHRMAISKRTSVAERVTDALVDFGEIEVMQSLLENAGAAISANAFELMAERSMSAVELREKICFRNNVPEQVLRRLMPFLDSKAREAAQALLTGAPEQLETLVRSAMPVMAYERSERAKRRLEIKALAQRVEANDVTLDGFIDDAVRDDSPLDLALALSELSLLPEKQMANAILSTEPEPLALICKATGMEPDTYLRAERLRRAAMKIGSEPPQSLLDSYGRLDTAQAQRTLRFVKLRTNLAAAG